MSSLVRSFKRNLVKRMYEDDHFHRKETVNWLNIQREKVFIKEQMRKQQQAAVQQRKGR